MLAAYALKGRTQAIGLVTLFFVVGLLLPPLSILALALITLIGLRLGIRPGLEVALGSSLILGIASLALMGSATAGLAMAILWIPMLLLALSLRYSGSLALTVQLAMLLALIIPLLDWLLVGGADAWQKLLEPLEAQLRSSGSLSAEEAKDFTSGLIRWLPALLAAGFFLQQVLGLFLARTWQARLFNPGGFQKEFHQLRLSQGFSWAATALLLGIWLFDAAQWSLGRSLLVLLAVLFLIQGLAVVHALLAKAGSGQFWLIGIYILLVLALPYMGMMLALTGYLDSWRDFRRMNQDPASSDAGS